MADRQHLLIVNDQAPGDNVVWTGVVREIHKEYPGRFLTSVCTHYPELWEANPHLTTFTGGERFSTLKCQSPSIRQANTRPIHFLTGCVDYVNQILGLDIEMTEFRGDIYLHEDELKWPTNILSPLAENGSPYWLICAGGKTDITVKWWEQSRYQEVVSALKDRILFVQVGAENDHHPPLYGTLDLRGKTTLRQLIHLMAHSQGVVCGVTFLMHLAAAVPDLHRFRRLRPCIVVAGGREPPHWEAYPGHQFIHTIGMLPCCAEGGCWKARTVSLGDGHPNDNVYKRCLDVINGLPKCMDLIQPSDVISRVERYIRHSEVWNRW